MALRKPGPTRSFSDLVLQRAIDMRRNGKTLREISNDLEIPITTLHKHLLGLDDPQKTNLKLTRITWQKLRSKFNDGSDVEFAWVQSFDNFVSDMGIKPAGHSLARRDVSKGYFRGNCLWASGLELKKLRYLPTVIIPTNIEKVKKLSQQGRSSREIAKTLELGKNTVLKILKQIQEKNNE